MARVERGETECFAELVRRYQPALARVAVSRLGRVDWAGDVVQETFLAAFKSRASYDAHFSFRTWLWTILLNQCHGRYQRRMRSVPLEPLTAQCEPASESGSIDADDVSPLARLLAKERAAQLEDLAAQLLHGLSLCGLRGCAQRCHGESRAKLPVVPRRPTLKAPRRLRRSVFLGRRSFTAAATAAKLAGAGAGTEIGGSTTISTWELNHEQGVHDGNDCRVGCKLRAFGPALVGSRHRRGLDQPV
jgi:RNA polymerase sigma-70 factor (ECF subfamily)